MPNCTASLYSRQLPSHSVKIPRVTTDCNNIIQSSEVIIISSNCRYSQADPSFRSVAMGEFTAVNSKFCICISLQIKCDSPAHDYVIMTALTCWQTSIHLSNHTIYLRNSDLQAASVSHWNSLQPVTFLLSVLLRTILNKLRVGEPNFIFIVKTVVCWIIAEFSFMKLRCWYYNKYCRSVNDGCQSYIIIY